MRAAGCNEMVTSRCANDSFSNVCCCRDLSGTCSFRHALLQHEGRYEHRLKATYPLFRRFVAFHGAGRMCSKPPSKIRPRLWKSRSNWDSWGRLSWRSSGTLSKGDDFRSERSLLPKALPHTVDLALNALLLVGEELIGCLSSMCRHSLCHLECHGPKQISEDAMRVPAAF